MAQLNFKYGLSTSLPATTLSEGSILVTTDTHSMFIDLQGKRFRLSDFEIYENVDDLINDQNSWYDGCLALIKSNGTNGVTNAPTLAFYDKGNNKWVNINDTSELSTAIAKNAKDIQDINTSIDGITASIKDIEEAIEGLKGGEGDSLGALRQALTEETQARITGDNNLLGTATDTADKNTIYGAKKAAANAQSTADAALPKAGGEITGNLSVGGTLGVNGLLTANGTISTTKVSGLTTPTANSDAANKKYVDDAKSTLLGSNTGTSTTGATIYDAKRAAAAAQGTANTANVAAAAAQGTADDALVLAQNALPKAGGAITENLSVGGTLSVTGTTTTTKVTGLNTPTQNSDAANKKYVDDAKSTLLGSSTGTSTTGATIYDAKRAAAVAKTAADAAQAKADAALPQAGGTITGTLGVKGLLTAEGTISTTKVSGLSAPSGNTDATNKQYVDGAIATAIATNDAMVFRGTVGKQTDGAGVGDLETLPTTATEYDNTKDAWKFKPQKGDTFKVAYAGTVAGITVKVGDLLINAGADNATPDWKHITSGYEDDYLQKIRVDADTNTVYLTDGVLDSELDEDQGVVTFKSGVVKTEGGSTVIDSTNNNIKIETHGTDICFSLEWGTF